MNHPLFNLTNNQTGLETIHANLILSGLPQIATLELVIVDTDGLEIRISKLHGDGAKEKK